MNQLGFVAILLLLAVSSYGWGHITLAALRRCFGTPIDADAHPVRLPGPVTVALGFSVFIGIGGIAVAFGVGFDGVLLGVLGVGAAGAAAVAGRRARTGATRWPRARTAGVGAAFTAVAFCCYGASLTGPINPNDDDPGYVYLAARLLHTGGMIDPFNLRRIVSYGGGELVESLLLRFSSSGSVLGVEWCFAILLITALVLGKTSRRYGAAIALLVGLGLTLFHPVGAWANSAPTFSGVALSLALLQLLEMRALERGNTALVVAAGLIVGALYALRYQFAIPMIGATVLVGIVTRKRACWRPLGVFAGVVIASLVGWAVALQRSSDTLIFPIFHGTYNTTFPWKDPAFTTTAQFLTRFWAEVRFDGWGVEMVVVLAGAALLVVLDRAAHRPPPVVTVAATTGAVIGCVLLVLAETPSLSGAVISDIGRYDAPSALAIALYLVALFCARLGEVPPAGRGARRAWWRPSGHPAHGYGSLLAAGVIVAIPLGANYRNLPADGNPVSTVVHAAYLQGSYTVDLLDGTFGTTDRWAAARPAYDAISAVIPKGAYVLAAVSSPGLLDFSRYTFVTLDIAGGASPPPGIPLTSGAPAVVAYLRHLGFDGIVASVTGAPGLDEYRAWKTQLTSGIEDYRAMAQEFVGWAHDLNTLNHDPAISRTRIGTLEYLSWSTPKGAR
jgi:hypothetical protein